MSIVFLLPQLQAQIAIKPHNFVYSEIDHVNCESQNVDITYPVFYSRNGKLLAEVNDSVRKILFTATQYFFEDSPNATFLFSNPLFKTDTSISIVDTLTEFDCDQIALMPDEESVSYRVFINTNQLLSFVIETSFQAGSGGRGGTIQAFPFCYDLKENEWIDPDALFPDKYDTVLIQKTDSLYLLESIAGDITDDSRFTGDVGVRQGSLIFYYSDRWGGKYFYREVIIPYEEYEKHLARRYRKLLKPPQVKTPGKK